MKKGELILSCLKLMYDIESNINSDEISTNADYEDRVVNIVSSIDRALSYISTSDKLPRKTISEIDSFCCESSLTTYEGNTPLPTTKVTDYVRIGIFSLYKWNDESNKYEALKNLYQMSYELPIDVYKVTSVTWYCDKGSYYVDSNEPIVIENNNLVLKRRTYGNYKVTYIPKYTNSISILEDTEEVVNGDNIVIPDYILRIVPYFVKADVYEEDDPNMSLLARNIFNSMLSEISSGGELNQQTKVKSTFRLVD